MIKSDVRNTSNLISALKRNDIIIPLAALVGAPICSQNPVGAKTINHDAVEFLFKKIERSSYINANNKFSLWNWRQK